MRRLKDIVRVAATVILVIWIGLAALCGLLRPMSSGCIMTYMYPTYIPISTPENVTSIKYGLYLYHEGWQKIDFKEHLKKLSGVPVLFIPGNGGSYKQVRSLAAESDRAYQRGPLERTFYQEGPQIMGMGQVDIDISGIPLPDQYSYMLDWFTVDLEGEHSAMDGRILEEHTEYVVYAIHRILDQYKESYDARVQDGAAHSGKLPKSVILVGHSVGGFVARAAVVHPHLRKSAVETVLTLSTPHQLPPLALQPSLGHYFAHINQKWRKGYEVRTSPNGLSDPPLSHVVVVSISGGSHDYQVRSKLESLDGIIPRTHGFMISSTAMKNVWLPMEHQVILWCNQLVVQVSHTLLSLIDGETGQPFSDVQRRLPIFTKMLHSGIQQNLDLTRQSQLSLKSTHMALQNGKTDPGTQLHSTPSCPNTVHWTDDGLERDLYIQTTTVTVLAMDGRRRWLDIHKLGSNGRDNFVFVTNLAPCSAIRLHLWPEKGTSSSESVNKRVLEVTSRMVHMPSGPAPKQVEPGSQTEQAPPSALFWLDSKDMRGFRFLTISVAPRPTVSGPPPATSMGVGQFFNPQEGQRKFSPVFSLLSMYSRKDMILVEDHPIAFNLSFSISLGLLPVALSIETTGCGIEKSDFSAEELEDTETSGLCKLRCFPPVALAWDATSGIHIFPNMYSKTIIVDSSPALWTFTQESEKTIVFLLVDPHCSYKTSVEVSVTAAAGRFLLLYFSQIMGLCITVVFFALMRQAHAWELDHPIPSVLSAVESNLRVPLPFLFLAMLPILLALFFSCLSSQPLPPVISFTIVSIICYIFANGVVVILIAISQLAFYIAATIHVFIKKRWQGWEGNSCFLFLLPFVKFMSSFLAFKVVRIMRTNPLLVIMLVSGTLVCLVHPALGLFILLLSHGICCHNALSSDLQSHFVLVNSYRMASVRSHTRLEEFHKSGNDVDSDALQFLWWNDGKIDKHFPPHEHSLSSPESAKSFSETQLEIFHHRHGLLILHLLAALSFVPSLMAWLQRIGIRYSFPWLLDSVLCLGVLLHGICDSQPEFNFFLFPIPGIPGREIKLSYAYLLAGFFSYLSGLALAPYRAFYAMAIIGVISFAYRILERRNRVKGETYFSSRKHSHKH